jgi:exonuclease III
MLLPSRNVGPLLSTGWQTSWRLQSMPNFLKLSPTPVLLRRPSSCPLLFQAARRPLPLLSTCQYNSSNSSNRPKTSSFRRFGQQIRRPTCPFGPSNRSSRTYRLCRNLCRSALNGWVRRRAEPVPRAGSHILPCNSAPGLAPAAAYPDESRQLPISVRGDKLTKRHFRSKPRGGGGKSVSAVLAALVHDIIIKLCFWNARGISRKSRLFADFLREQNATVAAVSETKTFRQKLDTGDYDLLIGSESVHTKRGKSNKTVPVGGLAFFLRPGTSAAVVQSRAECVWMRMQNVFIGNVYRNPATRDATQFFANLAADVARFRDVIIGGDLNIRAAANGDSETDNNTAKLLSFCEDNRLHLVNLLPCTTGNWTRVEIKPSLQVVERSTLDYVIVSDSLLPMVQSLAIVDRQFGSDHKPLVLTLRGLAVPRANREQRFHDCWRKKVLRGDDATRFKNQLEVGASVLLSEQVEHRRSLTMSQFLTAAEVNRSLDQWLSCVKSAAMKTVGRKRIFRNKQKSKAWFSPKLRKLRSELDAAHAALDDRSAPSSRDPGGTGGCSRPCNHSRVASPSLSVAGAPLSGLSEVKKCHGGQEMERSANPGDTGVCASLWYEHSSPDPSSPVLDLPRCGLDDVMPGSAAQAGVMDGQQQHQPANLSSRDPGGTGGCRLPCNHASDSCPSPSVAGLPLSGREKAKLYHQYQALRARYKSEIRRSQLADECRVNDLLYQAWDRRELALFWKRVGNRRGFYSNASTPSAVADKDGNMLADDAAVMARWVDYLRTLGNAEDDADPATRASHPFDEAFHSRVAAAVDRIGAEPPVACPTDPLWTMDELDRALSKLGSKVHTAASVDEIEVSFLVNMDANAKRAYLDVINHAWVAGVVPDGWRSGLIVPIFKRGGIRVNVADYRPITLTPTPLKLLELMMLERLSAWSDEFDVLAEEQAGFRAGRGTVEQVFILHEIIALFRERGLPLYLAFLDVKRAYDRVWRDGLLYRLWSKGVKGRMFRFIRNMLSSIKRQIVVNGRKSEEFHIRVGLPQGAVLSPWLYSVYINGLAEQLKALGYGVDVGGRKVALLLYADDICLLANSAEQLKEMLAVADRFARKWRFRYNCAKSNVVVCTSSSKLREEAEKDTWQLGAGTLEVTDEYRYLGIETGEMGPGRWWSYISRIASDTWAVAQQVLLASTGRSPLRLSTAVHLWKALARPILEYGDALWAGNISDQAMKTIEQVQTDFGRSLLTLSWHAPAVFVRSELGLQSMRSRALQASLRFYGKLVRMPAGRLAKHIFRLRCDQVDGLHYDYFDSSTHRLGQYSWCSSIKDTLTGNGCTDHWNRRFVPVNWLNVTRKIVNRSELQLVNTAFRDTPTLHVFQRLTRSGGPERWLDRSLAHDGVRIKVQMRGNCAPVYERVGTHNDTPREARLCRFCTQRVIESVQHVVAVCPCYADLRLGCLNRLRAFLQDVPIADKLAAALNTGSVDTMTDLFLGDLFCGLSADAYMRAHSIVLDYLRLLWKRRLPIWRSFCVDDDEWTLRPNLPDADG